MVSWQRRARLLAVVVALAVSAAVFVTSRRRERAPAPPEIARVDPSAVVESSGAFVRDVKGTRERFRVEAERQLTYSNGTTKLMGVRVTVDRGGKTFVVSGDEAQVGEKQSRVELNGHVHLEGTDGFKLYAGSASYSESDGIVRAPGFVAFSRGAMTGSGEDFTYDRNDDSIGLSDQASIHFAPDKKDTAGADIKAGSALLARKDKFASFERAVHIVRGRQTIDADRAVADLTEDEKHITALDLNGSARITKADATAGGLRSMSAVNIKLTYGNNSEVLQHAVLSSESVVKIAGAKGAVDKTLAAETMDIGLAPDGATLTSLTARDKVALDLPGSGDQPSKNIRSAALLGSGDAEHGLTNAVFNEGVEYRESGGAPIVQRLVRARVLEAALNNGLDEIRQARFTGNVQFSDGATQAASATVVYDVAAGKADLTGRIGNALPRVTTDQIVVDATHVELTLVGPKMTATDDVRTQLKPGKPGVNATRIPGLMQPDKPVSGTSRRLIYNGNDGSTAEFFDNVRLWQEGAAGSVRADKVMLTGSTGNLAAEGAVTSTFPVDEIDTATKQHKTTTANATAKEMLYEDAARKVTYRNGAILKGPEGIISADVIAVTLAETTNEVQRLEATGAVTLRETTRVTTGDNLVFVEADDQTYTVTGKPAKMVEDGCHVNTGRTLSFSKSTDKLRIDGSEDARTQRKSEGKCTEPRSN